MHFYYCFDFGKDITMSLPKAGVSGEEEKDTKKKVIFKRFGIKQEVVVVQG